MNVLEMNVFILCNIDIETKVPTHSVVECRFKLHTAIQTAKIEKDAFEFKNR